MGNKILSLIVCIVLSFSMVWLSSYSVGDSDKDITVNSMSETSATKTTEITELESAASTESISTTKVNYTQPTTMNEIEQMTTKSVKVTYPTEPVEDNLIKSVDFSAEDADLLLRIGMCEAGGEDVECIASVMCVVLNRAWSDSFPNSVHDVVYQSGQFTPVQTGWINIVEPSDKCYEALNMILNGWDESQNALYFESCSGESWHSRNLEYLYSYGNMKFYK